ncbi:MAG TPA: hypothetical protein VF193_03740 [Steroidobacter sp.]
MFATQMYRSLVERSVCLFLAACIVSAALTAGAVGVQVVEQRAIAEMTQDA